MPRRERITMTEYPIEIRYRHEDDSSGSGHVWTKEVHPANAFRDATRCYAILNKEDEAFEVWVVNVMSGTRIHLHPPDSPGFA
jgi:hypothetical protein